LDDSLRFQLEPLEPRRFLDAAALQAVAVEYNNYEAVGAIDARAGEDQAVQPAPFPDDGIASGRTDQGDDVNSFTFHAKARYVYSFRFTDDSPVQPYLSIRDEAGKLLDSQTNILCVSDKCRREFPFITWSPAADGTYTLEAWTDPWFDRVTRGEYKIVMNIIPPAILPDPAAPLIAPGDFSLASSTLATPHLFQFQARKGAAYSFSVGGAAWPASIIQILAGDGSVLADNSSGSGSDVNWSSATDTTVYLRIITQPDIGLSLNMSQIMDDQMGKPVDVTLPATVEGSIDFNMRGGPSDEDFFRFHAVGGRTYVVVNNGGSTFAQILDDKFVPLPDAPDMTDVSDRWTAPATGTYYLKVYGFQYRSDPVSGPYSFSVFEAPAEEQSQKPQQLELGSTITGQFYYPDDERMFTVEIPARNRYRFVLNTPAWGWMYLTHIEYGYAFAADAAEDGNISQSAMLEPGVYEVYIQSPSAGGFIMLADLASNFKNSADTKDQDQSDQGTDVGDYPGDERILYADDLNADESDSNDGLDSSLGDSAGNWLDDSHDPIDTTEQVVW